MSNPIKWCNETWNPVVGCSPVSAGCYNCYAARMAGRFCEKGEPFEGLIGREGWNGTVRFRYERLGKPFRWRKPRRIFVTSMGDLWHQSVTDEQIAAVMAVIATTPDHIYMDLTKRPDRRLEWSRWSDCWFDGLNTVENIYDATTRNNVLSNWLKHNMSVNYPKSFPSNYWAGVSVENQITANERIPSLIYTPAAKRFISFEPCLGPARFDEINFLEDWLRDSLCGGTIDLVIVGAETHSGKRPMDLNWARSVRDQCSAAGVPFWFKQDSDGNETLDGVEHHPEFWR